MKLFLECRKNFAFLGINSNQQTKVNGKLAATYIIQGISFIFGATFLFLKADTFQEYSNSAYITTSTSVSFAVFVNAVFKRTELFNYINSLDEFVEKSEYMLNVS